MRPPGREWEWMLPLIFVASAAFVTGLLTLALEWLP